MCMETLNPSNGKTYKRKYKENRLSCLKMQVNKLINYKPFMYAIDVIIMIMVIGPFTIMHWRSSWLLLDLIQDYLPLWPTVIFANCILICFNVTREISLDLIKMINIKYQMYVKFILRLYTYIYCWICVTNWRAIWSIIDTYFNISFNGYVVIYSGTNIVVLFAITAANICCLTLLKSLRNNIAPPLAVTLDKEEPTLYFPTRFRIQVGKFFNAKPINPTT